MSNAIRDKLVQRWSDPAERPTFKGSLIDIDGCCCAQGEALRCSGFSDNDLREMPQHDADIKTAEILGISVTHSVLLRVINDSCPGSPQDVLAAPEKILGKHADLVLEFWWHLDAITAAAGAAAWEAAGEAVWAAAGEAAWAAAREAAGEAVWAAAGEAAWAAAWEAAGEAVWAAAGEAAWAAARAAAGAANEIQGHELISSPLFFLPMFGVTIDQLKERAAARKAAIS